MADDHRPKKATENSATLRENKELRIIEDHRKAIDRFFDHEGLPNRSLEEPGTFVLECEDGDLTTSDLTLTSNMTSDLANSQNPGAIQREGDFCNTKTSLMECDEEVDEDDDDDDPDYEIDSYGDDDDDNYEDEDDDDDYETENPSYPADRKKGEMEHQKQVDDLILEMEVTKNPKASSSRLFFFPNHRHVGQISHLYKKYSKPDPPLILNENENKLVHSGSDSLPMDNLNINNDEIISKNDKNKTPVISYTTRYKPNLDTIDLNYETSLKAITDGSGRQGVKAYYVPSLAHLGACNVTPSEHVVESNASAVSALEAHNVTPTEHVVESNASAVSALEAHNVTPSEHVVESNTSAVSALEAHNVTPSEHVVESNASAVSALEAHNVTLSEHVVESNASAVSALEAHNVTLSEHVVESNASAVSALEAHNVTPSEHVVEYNASAVSALEAHNVTLSEHVVESNANAVSALEAHNVTPSEHVLESNASEVSALEEHNVTLSEHVVESNASEVSALEAHNVTPSEHVVESNASAVSALKLHDHPYTCLDKDKKVEEEEDSDCDVGNWMVDDTDFKPCNFSDEEKDTESSEVCSE